MAVLFDGATSSKERLQLPSKLTTLLLHKGRCPTGNREETATTNNRETMNGSARPKKPPRSILGKIVHAMRHLGANDVVSLLGPVKIRKQQPLQSRQVITEYLKCVFGCVNKAAIRKAFRKGVADGILVQKKQSFRVKGDPPHIGCTGNFAADRIECGKSFMGVAIPEQARTEEDSSCDVEPVERKCDGSHCDIPRGVGAEVKERLKRKMEEKLDQHLAGGAGPLI